MYQVLFAEDELLVRLGLQNSIPWEKYEMKLAAQADNGLTAFDLFQEIHPDVVITDIRMEGMSGLELIRKIRETDEECAVIVISCMDDFETLRQLIPYKIAGYILKASMSMDEIFGVLEKTRKYLEETGRRGKENGKEEEELSRRLAKYLEGQIMDFSWPGKENISRMLRFWLQPEDFDKINELAMEFVYELAGRLFPEKILVPDGTRSFCLLLPSAVSDQKKQIQQLNRSAEEYLGVRFLAAEETRREGESIKELYERLRKGQEEKAREQGWDPLICRAVEYMREHHRRALGLSEISGVLGISPSYFSHIFRKETGKNYVEFLNRIRMEEVLKELKGTDHKIAVVAENHGFNNLEYFSRFFKKQMGISPAKWRQQNK